MAAIVVRRAIVPKSVDKKSPSLSKNPPTKLINPIIASLFTNEVTIDSHATLTLFNAASIPSRYVSICANVAPADLSEISCSSTTRS